MGYTQLDSKDITFSDEEEGLLYIFEAKYKMPVTDNLVTTTKFVYKHQKPWNYPSTYDAYWVDTYINKVTSNKFTGEFNFSYNMGEENNITAGMIFDDLTVKDDDGDGSLENGKNKAFRCRDLSGCRYTRIHASF